MDLRRAEEILGSFSNQCVLVVGDMMLDEYIWGRVSRISPEAPVIVVDADRQTCVPGGAANVVNNVCALGARASVVGVIGVDAAGQTLREALALQGAVVDGLAEDETRPTTRKTRIIAHSQQVVRVDHESRNMVGDAVGELLRKAVMKLAESATAILLSDYRKGVLTGALMAECAAVARKRGIPITGNLKPEALGEFGSLTVVTLNLLEASQASGLRHLHERSEFQAAGEMLLTKTGAEHVLITQGSEGLTLFHRADKANPTHIPAHPVEVYDVAGAGDTVISTLTLALAASASMAEAAMLANVAAAEAVKKVGVATVSTQEILSGMRAAK